MSNPKIAGNAPIRIELEAGKKYFWCSCGESKNQPWCDGSHKGSAFTPTMVELDNTKTCSMCTCKQSSNGAFCDGSHKAL